MLRMAIASSPAVEKTALLIPEAIPATTLLHLITLLYMQRQLPCLRPHHHCWKKRSSSNYPPILGTANKANPMAALTDQETVGNLAP